MDKKGIYGLDPEKYPANMGKAWLDEEVIQLLQEIKRKKSIQEIAEQHQRTVGGITSRLKQLAADYHEEGRCMEDIEKFTGLTQEQITETIQRRKVGKLIRERRAEEKSIAKNGESTSKQNTQTRITSFTVEKEPTMKDLMKLLNDINTKLAIIIKHERI